MLTFQYLALLLLATAVILLVVTKSSNSYCLLHLGEQHKQLNNSLTKQHSGSGVLLRLPYLLFGI
jgi:hypothetical protein